MRPAPLHRKVLRDLWRMRLQVVAIAMLIACGVSVAVMSFSAQRALTMAQTGFYAETRFADVFANVRRAPLSLISKLEAIDGVTVADVRILESGLMDVPGLARPAVARVISLPVDERRALNRIQLVGGRMPANDRRDEVVALKTFIDAAHVELGQKLTAVIGGRAFSFTIVGAALSPEYVYTPAPGSLMPDDAHQAVFWTPRPAAEQAAGFSGAFNTVALALAPDASRAAVLQEVNRVLAPYGGRAAIERADQPSHAFLDAELRELSTSALIVPPVFLLVAAGLVHLVVSRLVDAERDQIGLLKAFGYRNAEAAWPYLQQALIIGLVGAAAGGLLGAAFGAAIVERYQDYFRFPDLEVRFHWFAFLAASAVATGSVAAGSLLAVRRAVLLSPAVAMQPPRPERFRPGTLDRLTSRAGLDQPTRMIVRRLERYPARALLAVLALAASLSLLVGTQFLLDSLERVVEQTYFRTQRWTETVSFHEGRDIGAVAEVARFPGVFAAEPVRVAPARLQSAAREEQIVLVGLSPTSSLNRPLDAHDRPIPLKGRGVILSEALADRLGLVEGDEVWVEVLDGRGPKTLMPITGLARDYSGFAAYVDRRELNRLIGEGDVANGAQLLVAADRRRDFYRAAERAPQIVGTSSRDETLAAWRMAMTEAFRVMITFYLGFSGAIAFGVAYNTTRISLSEQARDLATLRVLGFSKSECAYMLCGEVLILTLAAIPLGAAGGVGLAHSLVAAYSRDEVRLPAVISTRSYGLAIATYLIAAGLGAGLVVRRVWDLDLVAVLKARE